MSELAPFGTDCAWLAVRGKAQAEVLEALGLGDGEVVDIPSAVAAAAPGGRTALLPPLRGVGGRWTLVLGEDVAAPSAERVASLSALLATDVHAVSAPGGAGTRTLVLAQRGTVQRTVEVREEELAATAAELSIDPTGLTGAAPGSAVLVGHLRSEAPTPENEPGLVQLPHRPGLLRRLLGR